MFGQQPKPADTATFNENWMRIAEIHAPIPDLVTGHRNALLAAGASEGAADMMAVQYHALLMKLLGVNQDAS